jgi:hypothetical protein
MGRPFGEIVFVGGVNGLPERTRRMGEPGVDVPWEKRGGPEKGDAVVRGG